MFEEINFLLSFTFLVFPFTTQVIGSFHSDNMENEMKRTVENTPEHNLKRNI